MATPKKSKLDQRNQKLTDKWIKELTDMGLLHDEMLLIFNNARQKFLLLKETTKN